MNICIGGDLDGQVVDLKKAYFKGKEVQDNSASEYRKQTYICYDTYRRLARILPLLSDGMTVPAFLDNVLDHHLEVYEKELDEMVRLSTQNSH